MEHAELADIYVNRGLTPELAAQGATQLMAKNALSALQWRPRHWLAAFLVPPYCSGAL